MGSHASIHRACPGLMAAVVASASRMRRRGEGPERIAADTPKTTVAGNTFVAPAGWSLAVRGPATILEAPEGGSFIVLVDVAVKDATDADAAVAAAWAAYKPDAKWPLKVTTPVADKDGWTDRKSYAYQTSPNEKRDVGADVRQANDVWTVAIYDMAQAVGEKRGAQIGLIYGKLLPKGRTRESFAGKKANTLDDARLAELRKFVETSMKLTGVPGVSVGIYQDGRVVFAEGFGVRELGKPAKVDADTKYMIASNTKAMATLMLAKLVDAEEARVGHAGGEGPAVVQARRRRRDEPGADQAPHLRVHRHAAPGPRVAARVRRASRPTR